MASATPGGAPGYDYDKELGNNITHLTALTSQRLRGYTARSPEVKGRTPIALFLQFSGVPGVRRAFLRWMVRIMSSVRGRIRFNISEARLRPIKLASSACDLPIDSIAKCSTSTGSPCF